MGRSDKIDEWVDEWVDGCVNGCREDIGCSIDAWLSRTGHWMGPSVWLTVGGQGQGIPSQGAAMDKWVDGYID